MRNCPAAVCLSPDRIWAISEICRSTMWPPDHGIVTRDEQGPCLCYCASLVFGTPVQDGDGAFRAVQTYGLGQTVMAAGTDLDWTARPVAFSGATNVGRLSFAVMVTYADTLVTVTSDHLFLVDGQLMRADRLTPEDALTASDGNPVPIRSLHLGDYVGGLAHLAVSLEQAERSPGYLLNTNGVVSADYVAQVAARAEAAGFAGPDVDRLVIGSPEYVARYGRSSLEAPDLVVGFTGPPMAVADYDAPDLPVGIFVPGNLTIRDVPPNARS